VSKIKSLLLALAPLCIVSVVAGFLSPALQGVGLSESAVLVICFAIGGFAGWAGVAIWIEREM
jgi:hypothetical protein